MKSIKTNVLLWLLLLSIVFCCCKTRNDNISLELFEQNPVSIYWNNDKKASIDSFCANVVVYEDNNRRTGGAKIQNKYRISIKNVNEKQYVRLDFPGVGDSVAAKTIMTDGIQTLVIDTETGNIEQKIIPTETERKISNDLGFILNENSLTKINLSRIKEQALKLSLDISEKEIKNKLIISLPSSYFSSENETRLSTKVIFDQKEEVLESTETVSLLEDGSTIKLKTVPVYDECDNGELIKIGEYSEISFVSESKIPNVDGIDYIESLDELIELTDEEYNSLLASGNLTEIEEIPLGDPSDLSYIATIITLYEDIEINTLDDSSFKLIMGL